MAGVGHGKLARVTGSWNGERMSRQTRRAVLGAIFVLIASSPGRAAPADLFDVINQRLSHMQAVAAWKVGNGRPVEDLEREHLVLEAARAQAIASGLSGDGVTVFFQAQIDAAKDIQNCWIDRWRQGTPRPEDMPDLVEEIRPALLKLGDEILKLMSGETVGASDRPGFDEALTVDCLSSASKQALFESLLAVRD